MVIIGQYGHRWALLSAALLILFISQIQAWGSSKDKVLLRDVQTLTLHNNKMTTGRRSSPVPQLFLKGGTAAHVNGPLSTVQCYNRGFDGQDVQWECVSELPNNIKFGEVLVICEGYDYSDDPYILKGSCGLEYTLDFTDTPSGYQGSHQSNGYQYQSQGNSYYQTTHAKAKSSWFSWLSYIPLFFFASVVSMIMYCYCCCLAPSSRTTGSRTSGPDQPPSYQQATSDNSQARRRNRLYPDIGSTEYSGTQASAPPHSDAPPAYGWADSAMPGSTGTSTYSGSRTHTIFDTPSQSQSNTRTSNQSGTGGGFWSGLAAGGLAGYLFGNRGNRGANYYNQFDGYGGNSWWGGNRGNSWWGRSNGNSWWGSGNTGYSWGSRPSGGGWSGASSRSGGFGSGSTGTSRKSGYGGTARR